MDSDSLFDQTRKVESNEKLLTLEDKSDKDPNLVPNLKIEDQSNGFSEKFSLEKDSAVTGPLNSSHQFHVQGLSNVDEDGYDTCEGFEDNFFDDFNESENLRNELAREMLEKQKLKIDLSNRDMELKRLRGELNEWIRLSEERSLEIIKNLTTDTNSHLIANKKGSERLRMDVQLLINDHKYLKDQINQEKNINDKLRKELTSQKAEALTQINKISFEVSDMKAKNKKLMKQYSGTKKYFRQKESELNEDILFLSNEVIEFKKLNSEYEELLNTEKKRNKELFSKVQSLEQKFHLFKEKIETKAQDKSEVTALKDRNKKLEEVLVNTKEELTSYIAKIKKEHDEQVNALSEDYESYVNKYTEEIEMLRGKEQEISVKVIELIDELQVQSTVFNNNVDIIMLIQNAIERAKKLNTEREVLRDKVSKMKARYLDYVQECEKRISDINKENIIKNKATEEANRNSLKMIQKEIDDFKLKLKKKADSAKCEKCFLLKKQFLDLKNTLRETMVSNNQGNTLTDIYKEQKTLHNLDIEVANSIKALKNDFQNVIGELQTLKQKKDLSDLAPNSDNTEQKYKNSKKVINALCEYLERHNDGLNADNISNILRKVKRALI